MIVYFANRELDLLGQASTSLPDSLMVISDSRTEDIESGLKSLSLTITFEKHQQTSVQEMTRAGNYIFYADRDAGQTELYAILESTLNAGSKEVEIYAEDAGLDLINAVAPAYSAPDSYIAKTYINRFISGTGFEIGTYEIASTAKRKIEWTSESSVTERLQSIATRFGGCEVSYSFAVENFKVTHKYVNFYKERGIDAGVQLRLGRELVSITTTETVENLATGFRITGGTPEGKKAAITLKGYTYDDGTYYVDKSTGNLISRKGVEKWKGAIGSIIYRDYDYDTTSQSTLCNHAVAELKKVDDVQVNYEVELSYLPNDVHIGDWISIVDDAGETYISARVLNLKTSVTDQTAVITIGEYKIKSSGISDKVQTLANQFQSIAQNRYLYTWFAYADDDQGTGITLDPDGKTYLGQAVNQTEEDVDISDASIFVWTPLMEGGKGITLTITSDSGTLFKDSLINAILTAHIYKDGVELDETAISGLGTIYWRDSEGNALGTGITYTVTDASSADIIAELED